MSSSLPSDSRQNLSEMVSTPAKKSSASRSTRSPQDTANLVDLLRWRAEQSPVRELYRFLTDGNAQHEVLTYARLDLRARAIAAWLQDVTSPGERALLVCPQGLPYIEAFFGCLYAGVIAVPAYPPLQNRNIERLYAIAKDAQPSVLLTTDAFVRPIQAKLAETAGLEQLRCCAVDSIPDEWAQAWQDPNIAPDSLAFLQYTSGSTARPKGVMVSHANLLHNEEMIRQAFGQTEESIIVGWLPLFHDMGLIGSVLQPLYIGATCVLFSPVAFLQRPLSWLEAISQYRATTSGGPNFAYDLCVRKINAEQARNLDLSSWTVAFNGAEPVSAGTMDRFSAAFESCGFRRSAFFPCYGLAEATLLVSGKPACNQPPTIGVFQRSALEERRAVPASAEDRGTGKLVSCGRAWPDQAISILDPDLHTECASGHIGEIWVSSDSVAQGYWNDPESSNEVFNAHVQRSGEVRYLRTGDLGFIHEGELFITGRLKDLIIIRGRNHYPQDIEITVGKCSSVLRPGEGAAFSVEVQGEERLVVVYELARGYQEQKHDLPSLVDSILRAVTEQHELRVYGLVLVQPGSILKTSSGKIQRRAIRQAFQQAKLAIVMQWLSEGPEEVVQIGSQETPAGLRDIEEWLAAAIAAKGGFDRTAIDVKRSSSRYGMDSLTDVELLHQIESVYGVSLSPGTFLSDIPIAAIAEEISVKLQQKDDVRDVPSVPGGFQKEFPLSAGQAALWFLHRLAPESAAYNVIGAAQTQRIDRMALQSALHAIADRHPILRSRFVSRDGLPVQIIQDDCLLSIQGDDVSGMDDVLLKQRIHHEIHRPFDLEHGPVVRIVLLTRKTGSVLLFVAHHIVMDFWSLGILARELSVLYEAAISGGRASLPELKWSYSDYVRWQTQKLSGKRGEDCWDYWREQLAGQLPVLNMPTDHSRPAFQTFQGRSESIRLSIETTARIQSSARHHGATFFTFLLAAYATLLYRYTGQEELIVGSPTSGRPDVRFQALLGYFVNPIALRIALNAKMSFATLIEQVRKTVLGALAHQEYPFATLVDRLQPQRDPGFSPVFQTMFALQKAPAFADAALAGFALGEQDMSVKLGPLELKSIKIEQQISQFDLTMFAAEVEGSLVLSAQYATDLFEAATIHALLENFTVLLESVAGNPEDSLAGVSLLTSSERQQLAHWNCKETHYPEQLVHQLFEEQVEKAGAQIALERGTKQWSYVELNQRANQVAHYLKKFRAGPEVRVAICMERSLEMVAGLLGILKSGACYVPLDPQYPVSRLHGMLEDSQASLLLTEEKFSGMFSGTSATVISLDERSVEIAGQSVENPVETLNPQNLAYVIYTSGSTGRPKGVAIAHSSTAVLVQWAREIFQPEELAGVLASTSICFDLSVFELFVPLCWGGRAIITGNALEAQALMATGKVKLINTVPSAISELLSMKGLPSSVITVNLAGEALPRELIRKLYAEAHIQRVFNLYGPTEDTTYSTYGLMGNQMDGPVSIGMPIANTKVYVLDGEFGLAPAGVAGELYIGGEGLARGYLNLPDLTAERFLPNPYDGCGSRIYRTGDQARWRRDGTLDYLGRLDDQVKLRGYRIEMGEITAALMNQQGVVHAAVLLQRDKIRGACLVAYVAGKELSREHLRSQLKQHLPEYMVPSVIMVLEQMPLTPNGKLDRKRLPQPEIAGTHDQYTPPRNPVEETLCGIWSEVLGVERVGVHDNFFELGGHSLLATQVLSRIRRVLSVELMLRVLFELPTISALAERIADGVRVSLSPIHRADRTAELPLSCAQLRLWVLEQISPGSAYNVPVTLHLHGQLNRPALEQTLTEVVRRHEILRTFFPSFEGKPSQVITPPAPVSLPFVDLTGLEQAEQEAEVRRAVSAECRRVFDLNSPPLVRFLLLQLDTDRHVIFCNMHHIVSDGWSISVLMQEVSVLYEAFMGGKASPLPELSIQYAEYAVWQKEKLQGESLESEIDYWIKQLADAPPVLQLVAESRPAIQTYNGARELIQLSKSLTEALNGLSREAGVTLFMTLLAAFKALLYRYSGRTDLIVGTNVAGRSTPEIEPLIGFFVNMLVLRTECSPTSSFREFLAHVRDVTLKAFSHQELPFEMLVERLQPERNLSYPPLFQVVFSLQNAPTAELALPGLTITYAEPEERAAKYDLLLDMREGRQGLTGVLEYNTDLFNENTARQIVRHYHNLLQSVVAHPDQWLAELPLLSDTERSHLLFESNRTRTTYPQSFCIHQLFEQTAARVPDKRAIVAENGVLSYRELDYHANQVARHLTGLGIGPGSLVGLCFEHSPDEVIALLGVLKAGAAYVPLDPEYPQSRLSSMLVDASVSVVLTVRKFADTFSALGISPIYLDSDWAEIARHGGDAFEAQVIPDAIAYVIYTSGSTGRPKGVPISHRSLVNYILWAKEMYGVDEEVGVPLYSSLAFDLTVTSIYTTLITGNQLVLYRQQGKEPPLEQILDDDRIGILKLTPTHLSLIKMRDNTRSKIKRFIVGGEALTTKLCREINQSFGRPVEIFNEYGPTEATVGCMIYRFDPDVDHRVFVPVGRPAANTEIYVLDSWFNPAPKKVIGDLYIAGDGLAQGYLNRPELTAERFLPNPFCPGERMYKTGDLACWLDQDVIEFLGRADEQVKLHGFRIELGEIEAALRTHAQVADAAVLLREDLPGDKRLVAYVCPLSGVSLQISELRRFMYERVPAFMAPSTFVVLDAMPTSSNGKVDRRWLPSPDGERPGLESSYAEPQTETEQVVAAIWREVLRINEIGTNDNFFELGGQSVLAIQIIQRVNAAFAINLPMRAIFEESTIAGLSLRIEETLILRLERESQPEFETDATV